MAYIKITLDDTNLYDGQVINFKAPCDCSVPEGIKICDKTFDFVDSMGHNILGASGFFVKDAVLSVILDVTNSKAYVQSTIDGRGIIRPTVKAQYVLNDSKAGPLKILRTLGESEHRKTTGKNLIGNMRGIEKSTSNGITWTYFEGVITANGTATADSTFSLTPIDVGLSLTAGKYFLSGCPDGGSGTTYYVICTTQVDAGSNPTFSDYGSGKVVDVVEDKAVWLGCRVKAGTTVTNLEFRPQLEAGEVGTEYEMFTGGTASPNTQYPQPIVNMGQKIVDGWQLANLPDVEEIEMRSVIWSCKNGVITAKGTSAGGGISTQSLGIYADYPIIAGNYHISGSVGEVYVYCQVTKADGSHKFYKDVSFVLDGTETFCRVYAQIKENVTVDTTVYPMLNVGTEAKPWEPYTCGGYTDGSQLFDENNLIMINAGEYGFTSPRKGVVLDITGTVTFSQSSSSKIVVYKLYNKDTATLGASAEVGSGFTVTVAANEVLIMHSDASGDWSTVVRGMLNRGTSARAWQPYTAGMKPVIDIPIETEVLSENLYNSSFRNGSSVTSTRGTTTEDNGLFSLVASDVDAYIWEMSAIGSNYGLHCGPLNQIPSDAKKITINLSNSAFNKNYISFFDEDKVTIQRLKYLTNVFTVNIPDGTKYFSLRFGVENSVSGTTYKTTVMVNVGLESLPYQPYTKQSLTINKPGGFAGVPVTDASLANFTDEDGQMRCCDERDWEQDIYVGNMFDANAIVGTNTKATATVESEGRVIKVVGSKSWAQSNIFVLDVNSSEKYTISASSITGGNNPSIAIQKGSDSSGINTFRVSDKSITFEVPNGETSIKIVLVANGSTTDLESDVTAVFTDVMIRPVEIDGIPTSASYVPYSGGVFKKMYGADVQRVGRTVFDGSDDESWAINITNTTNKYRLRTTSLIGILLGVSQSIRANMLCTHYTVITANTAGTFGCHEGIAVVDDGTVYVYDDNFNTSDLSLWKEYLSSKPITIQYILTTPIYHHIPEEEAAARRALMANEPATTIISDAPVEVEYATNSVGAMALDNEVRSKENERKIQENEAKDIEIEAKLIKLEEEPKYSTRLDNINILDVVENGKYFAVGCTGSPSGSVGYLEVHNHPSAADKYRKITWSPYENGNITFQNIMLNGTWSGWVRLLTSADFTANGDTLVFNWL